MFHKLRKFLLVPLVLMLCSVLLFGCGKKVKPGVSRRKESEIRVLNTENLNPEYSYELIYRAGLVDEKNVATDLAGQGFKSGIGIGFEAFRLEKEDNKTILVADSAGGVGTATYELAPDFNEGTDVTILFRAKSFDAQVGFEVDYNLSGAGSEKFYNESNKIKLDRKKANAEPTGLNTKEWNIYRLTFTYDINRNATVNVYINEEDDVKHSVISDVRREADVLHLGSSSTTKSTKAAYEWFYLIKGKALSPTDKSLEQIKAEVGEIISSEDPQEPDKPEDPIQSPVTGSIFVTPYGKVSNPGTIEEPTTLEQAVTMVNPGGIIYLRGGTYSYSTQITIERGNNGEAGNLKQIFAYGSEEPLLDFSAQEYNATDPSKNLRGLQINGDYWHVKGLKVKSSADNGIFIGGSHNTIENCETYENRDSGLQLGRYSKDVTNIEDWPSYNLILNCYSHDNFDPDNGEDADGFGCKLTTGYGNVFRGCIAAYNVDDGWDLYTKTATGPIGPVTLENCIAHHNGRTSDGKGATNGDKNGFKLGGSKIPVDHIVTNCIAFNNLNHGFDNNSNTGSMTITNCTAFNNAEKSGKYNFNFDEGAHTFINNLSYKPARLGNNDHSIYSGNTNNIDVDGKNVVWRNNQATSASGLKVTDADFVSLTVPAEVFRNFDGSPDLGDFLALASGSSLIGAGTGGVNIGARGNTGSPIPTPDPEPDPDPTPDPEPDPDPTPDPEPDPDPTPDPEPDPDPTPDPGEFRLFLETFDGVADNTNIRDDNSQLDNPENFPRAGISGKIYAGTEVSGSGAITLDSQRMAFTVTGLSGANNPFLKVTIKNDNGKGGLVSGLKLAVGDSYSTGGQVGESGITAHGEYEITNTSYKTLVIPLNKKYLATNTIQFRGRVGSSGTAGLHIDRIEVVDSAASEDPDAPVEEPDPGTEPDPGEEPQPGDNPPDVTDRFKVYGFAAVPTAEFPYGTTGGAGGEVNYVSNGADLQEAIDKAKPKNGGKPQIIYVQGEITLDNTGASQIDIKEVKNVSVIGVGTSAVFNGIGINIAKASNIIVQNITVHHNRSGQKDAISIQSSGSHIWIDHCELYNSLDVHKDYYDELLSAKNSTEYITFSWNYLHDSWKTSLIGSSDSDTYDRKITYHHNLIENCNSRLPSYRGGTGHIYNNYYKGSRSSCINSRVDAKLLIQNNYFENCKNPIGSWFSKVIGYWYQEGNIFDNCTTTGSDDVDKGTEVPVINYPNTCEKISLPYSVTLESAEEAKASVLSGAGVGKI